MQELSKTLLGSVQQIRGGSRRAVQLVLDSQLRLKQEAFGEKRQIGFAIGGGMKQPTGARLFSILRLLDWSGHIELGDRDLKWLANELACALSPTGDSDLCEICEIVKPIVVRTTLGRICEDCLDSMNDEATDMREQLEDSE